MTGFRAVTCLALAAGSITMPQACHAQLDDRTVVSVVRECRKIEDLSARVACYDNIPIAAPPASAPSGASSAPAAALPSSDREFGRRGLPQQVPQKARAAEERLMASVAAVSSLSPGIYVLTLEDGAQWQFVDAVAGTYDPPGRGSSVEIAAAALGSYLMTYQDQRGVRVRRVR